jgi:anti-sigma factor (TIGR02949 family)
MEEIDCSRALHALYEFLDGELTVDRRAHIEYHLRGCEHCFSAFDFEAELRMVVKSRLQHEVPPSLRQRVLDALAAEGCIGSPQPPNGGAPSASSPLPGTPGTGFGATAADDRLPRFGL